jgi:asparagine synthase (glutamine-hydrolysing)
MHGTLLSSASEQGFTVMLNGFGGDEYLAGSYYRYADHIRNLDIRNFISDMHSDPWVTSLFPGSSNWIWRSTLQAFTQQISHVPYNLIRKFKRLIIHSDNPVYDMLAKNFTDRINLEERLSHKHNFKNFPSFHSAYTYYGLSNGFHQYVHEQIEREGAFFGIEYRFPFWDQRLMEFCLLIPDNQRLQGHTKKRILRNAAVSYLPPSIRSRNSKGDYSGTLSTFIVNHKYLLEEGLEIAKIGWVDQNRVNDVYADWGEDFSNTCYNNSLYAVFATELWYRSVISR